MTVSWKIIFLLPLINTQVMATSRNLPYPDGDKQLSGTELAHQVYFVNHLYAFNSVEIAGPKHQQIKIINAIEGKKPTRLLARRYVRHNFSQANIKTMDMLIITTGKQKGVGILATDYQQQGRSMGISVWLPALRKVRRFTEPEHDEIWAGSILTYGDIYLRRVDEETHEISGEATLDDCLETIAYDPQSWPDKLYPEADCSVQGKSVFILKSSHKQPHWWYDERLRWVDKKTFADYKTVYYKSGKPVKTMTKSWSRLTQADPRAVILNYWFARSEINGQQSLAYIPVNAVKVNTGRKESFWSEATLRKITR